MVTVAPPVMVEIREEDDLSLILRSQKGDTSAYGMLITRYQDGLVRVIYHMCGDMHLAEEAAQDAFLRAWQHLHSYRPEFAFRAWVYRIGMNAALDRLRRDRRLTAIDDDAQQPWMVINETPETIVVSRQRAESVRKAVLKLPEGSRAVLVLREYSQFTYAEIASALNIPIGTVMSRLNSARTQLRNLLVGVLEVL